VRQRLAQAHIGLEIMRLNALRTLAGSEAGALRPEALIGKLYWATFHRALGELAMDVLGAGAMTAEDAALQRLFLFSRADTIYAGSNQIQRTVVGERALGLPKEPR
jgi:alkylation response protein AidB-like acyl-CoA dehydrogenase